MLVSAEEGEEEEMFSGGLGFEEGSVISGFCPILVFAEQCLLIYIYIYIYTFLSFATCPDLIMTYGSTYGFSSFTGNFTGNFTKFRIIMFGENVDLTVKKKNLQIQRTMHFLVLSRYIFKQALGQSKTPFINFQFSRSDKWKRKSLFTQSTNGVIEFNFKPIIKQQ